MPQTRSLFITYSQRRTIKSLSNIHFSIHNYDLIQVLIPRGSLNVYYKNPLSCTYIIVNLANINKSRQNATWQTLCYFLTTTQRLCATFNITAPSCFLSMASWPCSGSGCRHMARTHTHTYTTRTTRQHQWKQRKCWAVCD